jgi:3-hydroxyisobutyrate dehydrogenase-like beta-hydroxyacid dehydrogenase
LVGAGLLGSAIGERLRASGFEVVAFDLEPARRTVATLDEAMVCERLVLSLPDSTVSQSVVANVPAGRLVIDTTTGDPDHMAALAAQAAARGVAYLDACVGGSSDHVRRGEAVMMVGAVPEDFERARDLLGAVTAKAIHVGAAGAGARMKLVFNLVLGLNRLVLAEGLAFAERVGVDARAALEALRAGPAYSAMMDSKGAKMLDRDFAPQARLAQHLKDVRLILELAERHGAEVPLSSQHRSILESLEEAGLGEKDNSVVVEWFRTGPRPPRAART